MIDKTNTKIKLVKPYKDLTLEELAKMVREMEYENERLRANVEELLNKIEKIRMVLKNL